MRTFIASQILQFLRLTMKFYKTCVLQNIFAQEMLPVGSPLRQYGFVFAHQLNTSHALLRKTSQFGQFQVRINFLLSSEIYISAFATSMGGHISRITHTYFASFLHLIFYKFALSKIIIDKKLTST